TCRGVITSFSAEPRVKPVFMCRSQTGFRRRQWSRATLAILALPLAVHAQPHRRHGWRGRSDQYGNAGGDCKTGGSGWNPSFGHPEREGSRVCYEGEKAVRQSDGENGRRNRLADRRRALSAAGRFGCERRLRYGVVNEHIILVRLSALS